MGRTLTSPSGGTTIVNIVNPYQGGTGTDIKENIPNSLNIVTVEDIGNINKPIPIRTDGTIDPIYLPSSSSEQPSIAIDFDTIYPFIQSILVITNPDIETIYNIKGKNCLVAPVYIKDYDVLDETTSIIKEEYYDTVPDNLFESEITVKNIIAISFKCLYTGGVDDLNTNDISITINGKEYDLTSYYDVSSIDQPSITSPTSSTTNMSELNTTFYITVSNYHTTSTFNYPSSFTQVQVSKNSSFTELVSDFVVKQKDNDFIKLSGLEYSTQYYLRVRHTSDYLEPSLWSNITAFATRTRSVAGTSEVGSFVLVYNIVDKEYSEIDNCLLSSDSNYLVTNTKVYDYNNDDILSSQIDIYKKDGYTYKHIQKIPFDQESCNLEATKITRNGDRIFFTFINEVDKYVVHTYKNVNDKYVFESEIDISGHIPEGWYRGETYTFSYEINNDGSTIIIRDRYSFKYSSENTKDNKQGLIYIFDRIGSIWSLNKIIKPTDITEINNDTETVKSIRIGDSVNISPSGSSIMLTVNKQDLTDGVGIYTFNKNIDNTWNIDTGAIAIYAPISTRQTNNLLGNVSKFSYDGKFLYTTYLYNNKIGLIVYSVNGSTITQIGSFIPNTSINAIKPDATTEPFIVNITKVTLSETDNSFVILNNNYCYIFNNLNSTPIKIPSNLCYDVFYTNDKSSVNCMTIKDNIKYLTTFM